MSSGEEHLPCGVHLAELVAQVADDAPPPDAAHQSRCPYCQSALRALRRAWGDLQTLARQPVVVPPGLTTRIMTRVRELAASLAHAVILGGPRGETRISHAVIGQVARRAALAVPGVLFASAHPTASQPAHPTRLALAVQLVIAFGPAAHALAAAVRATVRDRVTVLTGTDLTTIDVAIDDIADPPGLTAQPR